MARWEKKHDSNNLESMEYRGIEYTLVQGIKPGVWEWTASAANLLIMGKAPSRPAAVAAVERAINQALTPTKARLVPRGPGD
jgi:hypothetical protein